MVKYYETTTVFNYAWDQLASAFWYRYPNPMSSHVLSEDTLFRTLLNNHELYSRRLLTKTNKLSAPMWGAALRRSTGGKVVIVEESLINPVSKTITTYTRNVGYSSKILSVVEKVVYRPAEGKTEARKEAWVESSLFGFRRPLEKFGIERFKKQSGRAVIGFNYVLAKMYPGAGGGGDKNEVPVGGGLNAIKEKARLAKEMAKERARRLSNVYADASKKPES